MERGSIKFLIVQTAAIIIAALFLYPLFDLIICKLIKHSDFVYSVNSHIIQPIIFGTIAGTTFWIIDKKTIKKDK